MTGDESSARTCSEEARVKADSLGEKASGMEKKDDSNFQPEHLGEGTCTLTLTHHPTLFPASKGPFPYISEDAPHSI